MIGLIPNLGPSRKWGFDLNSYKQALNENIQEELDYGHELKVQGLFYEGLQIPSLITPKVYPELSNGTVLVQSWEGGKRLEEAGSFSVEDRVLIARTLMVTLFRSIFELGYVHADPHQGNYFFNASGGDRGANVVMLDYGSTVKIDYEVRMSLLKLLIGAKQKNATDPLACFVGMGFEEEKLGDIEKQLPAMCGVLFEPFLQDLAFDHKRWDIGDQYECLLGELKWWFRSAAPANLFLIMRAFSGLIKQLNVLCVNLPWWELLEIAVSPQTIGQAIAFELPERKISADESVSNNFFIISKVVEGSGDGEWCSDCCVVYACESVVEVG